jgi:ornithine cyclodeaminase/alanine dehydrogenase-like protein (mu-crystallin family)
MISSGDSTPHRKRNLPSVHACEQASHGGELAAAVEAGSITREDVTQLGDVLAAKAEGRRSARDITLFDSTGLAIQDLAIAKVALAKADRLGLPRLPL